jgi:hypothetical protein
MKMNMFLKIIGAFLAAIVTADVLACIGSTQFVLAGLTNMGMDVSIAVRFSATIHDVVGMAPPYAVVIAVAFLLAFAFSALLLRWIPGSRVLWYSASGTVAIIAALLIVEFQLGGMLVGGARTPMGLAVQGLAGGLGGWVFARLLPRRGSP